MRILIALVLVTVTAVPLNAQDTRVMTRNAWGISFAPMNYGLAEGYSVETTQSYSSLDVGLFYTRFFSPSWSGRLEVFSLDRDYNTFAPAAGAPDDISYFVVNEAIIQADLVLHLDRRFELGTSDGRVFIGGGVMVSGIHDQTVVPWYPADVPTSSDPGEGTYFKWGWLLEGGMSVTFYRRSAIFALLRMQQDEDMFGESDDADIARELGAYGFHVGMEYGF
jgi:hypothetical protein